MKIIDRELVQHRIVERITFDEVGKVPEKIDKAFVQGAFGCCALPYRCHSTQHNECQHSNICDYASEGLVTLTPTDDPLVYTLTAEYRE